MALVTPEDVFNAACNVEPGFSMGSIETVLGLGRNSLHRLFNTPGFVKMPVGYGLATRDYETWKKLCGLTFETRNSLARVAETKNRLDEIPIATILAAVKADAPKVTEWMLTDFDARTDAVEYFEKLRDRFEAWLYICNYAIQDKRTDKTTIWEARPL